MTAPLRERLVQIVVKAILDGGPLADHTTNIADAVLASEEWQARQTVVEAAMAMPFDARRLEIALTRFKAARGESE